MRALEAKMQPLLSFPEMGTARGDYFPALRVFSYDNYNVYHRYLDEHIEITRVLHAASDPRRIFGRYNL